MAILADGRHTCPCGKPTQPTSCDTAEAHKKSRSSPYKYSWVKGYRYVNFKVQCPVVYSCL